MMRSDMYSESDSDVELETGKLIECISVYYKGVHGYRQ